MAKICLCLTGKTLSRNLELIEKYRNYIDMAELRVDCLDPDENFYIRGFPEQAGIPVILTIRRRVDGGQYIGGEGNRITLLSRGLAFAEADRRHNFAYVDIEEDLDVPGLEEAARTFGTRIIRSCHNLEGVENISRKLKSLRRIGDEIAKIAVSPRNLSETAAIYRAARTTRIKDKIILGMGEFGVNTRILAEKLGSFLSYTSALEEEDIVPGASGHISPIEMIERYRFRDINAATDIYSLVGYPITTSYSPRIFNTVFHREKINAVYLPFPSQSLEHFMELAEELGFKGSSVTIPYQEEILPYLTNVLVPVRTSGSCNTIKSLASKELTGTNTEISGFTESLLQLINKKNLRGQKITVLGAGGSARAIVSEIFRLKGKCLILNRGTARARELALRYNYKWGGLDSQALDRMEWYSDIIIQATPVGTFPNIDEDPFPLYHFNGHETVLDLIYNPSQTVFLKRAVAAGCRVLNGVDMLVRQAKYQYQYFLERDFPEKLIPILMRDLQS